MKRDKEDKLEKIVWYDACSKISEDKQKVLDTPVRELIEKTTTYGYILKEDDYGIVIVTSENSDEVDYTVIPKQWEGEYETEKKQD